TPPHPTLFPYTTLFRSWAARSIRSDRAKFLPRLLGGIASIGYAIPGTVLAIGLLSPLVFADRVLNWIGAYFGGSQQLLIMGSTRSEEHTSELQSRENLV